MSTDTILKIAVGVLAFGWLVSIAILHDQILDLQARVSKIEGEDL